MAIPRPRGFQNTDSIFIFGDAMGMTHRIEATPLDALFHDSVLLGCI
jgi:hypothetical protein